MQAVLTREEVEFKSAEDLLKNNAASGGSRQEMRAIEDELEAAEQVAQAKSFANQQAAMENISAVQQAPRTTQAVLNPITGEVYQVEDGYDDELSVASILSLIERGASEEEIVAAIGAALDEIALDASDEKKTKRRLAKVLEVLHVLEVAAKQRGATELQANLRSLQENLSKLMASKNASQLQDFLRSAQLRDSLRDSTTQSRQSAEFLRSLQALTRSLAAKNAELNAAREQALQAQQAALRDSLQAQLRATFAAQQQAFQAIQASANAARDAAEREAANRGLRQLAEQAQRVRQLAEQNGRNQTTTVQAAEQARAALAQIAEQTAALAQTQNLQAQQQQVLGSLVATQQSSLQAVDARLAAQRVSEGNLRVANEAGKQDVKANLQAQLDIVARAKDGLENATKVTDRLVAANQNISNIDQQIERNGQKLGPNGKTSPCVPCSGGCCDKGDKASKESIESLTHKDVVQQGTRKAEETVGRALTEAENARALNQANATQKTAEEKAALEADLDDFMSAGLPSTDNKVTSATQQQTQTQSQQL